MMSISNRTVWLAIGLALLAGCGGVRVTPVTSLPAPLVEQEPITIGVHYPEEFRNFTHREERYQVKYEAALGAAHVAKLDRLLGAMFREVLPVEDPSAGDARVRFVLVPRFEDYAFLTPRDVAGESYIVTVRYRIDVYSPEGERLDGYVLTGYGRQKSGMMSGAEPLKLATERAMRDAAAKVATELFTQDTIKALLGRPVEAQLPVSSEPTLEPSSASDLESDSDSPSGN